MVRRRIAEFAIPFYWTARDGWPIRRIDYPPADSQDLIDYPPADFQALSDPKDLSDPQGLSDKTTPILPAKGSLLFLTGRAEFYEKYLETYLHWHAQGWHVTASEWRGQGGSGRIASNPMIGHIESFGQWVDDLAFLWQDWRAAQPGPHVVVAHSMGGHLVMRALIEQKINPDAVVLSAPMLGIGKSRLLDLIIHKYAQLQCLRGDHERPAWSMSEGHHQQRQKILTHDLARYQDEQWWRAQHPELNMGPPSWRWVEQALASTIWCGLPSRIRTVKAPLLILSTSADALTSHHINLRYHRHLPNSELFSFGEESGHEILRERDSMRDVALEKIDDFLARTLAGDHRPETPVKPSGNAQ